MTPKSIVFSAALLVIVMKPFGARASDREVEIALSGVGDVAQLCSWVDSSESLFGGVPCDKDHNRDADMTVVSEVPEISTFSMLLLGFAAVGFSGYRRNRAAGFPI
jgi:hypothetical protein